MNTGKIGKQELGKGNKIQPESVKTFKTQKYVSIKALKHFCYQTEDGLMPYNSQFN